MVVEEKEGGACLELLSGAAEEGLSAGIRETDKNSQKWQHLSAVSHHGSLSRFSKRALEGKCLNLDLSSSAMRV